MNWSEFRAQIRRSVLKEPVAVIWTDQVLMDLCGWAMDTFSAHTAAVSSITYAAAETLAVPENLFGDLETNSMLYFKSSNDVYTYFEPTRLDNDSDPKYSVWGNEIVISPVPTEEGDVILKYFALYPHPTDDNSVITIPAWSRNAVAHLVGALAQTSVSVQSAGIDRWKTREEAGSPEDNALRMQQVHMMKFYETEISRFPRQNRENYYRRY